MTQNTSWDLGSFSLDTTGLWNTSKGPQLGDVNQKAAVTAAGGFKEKTSSGKVGFYDWPDSAPREERTRMAELAAHIRSHYKGALICGIGGSHLGAAAALQALRDPQAEEEFPIWWLTNIDSDSIRRAKRFQEKYKCATILISKSGNTVETLSGFSHLSKSADPAGIVAVTDPKSGDLRRMATQYKWESFEVPPNIGGRFSVLTAVGMFPALLGNLEAEEMLKGAAQMRAELEKREPAANPAYLFAWACHLWDTKHAHPMHYLMPYQAPLTLFADWFVQLWGESLGKRLSKDPTKPVGPTPVGALGTTDQHSLLQLFREGPPNKIVGFMNAFPAQPPLRIGDCAYDLGDQKYLCRHTFEEISQKASLATEASLRNAGVPTYRIEVPCLTAKALGALFFFFETACAYSGELYGVDAFNQPGVEESKKLLRASL